MDLQTELLNDLRALAASMEGVQPSSPELTQLWGPKDDATPESALTLSYFWAAISLISEAMGCIPVKVMRKKKSGGWDYADQHPVNYMFGVSPGMYQSAPTYKSLAQSHLFFSGNHLALISRNGRGQAVELEAITPVNVRYYVNNDRNPVYQINRDHTAEGKVLTMPSYTRKGWEWVLPDDVFHVKAFSTNRYVGMSVLEQARKGISFGHSVNTFGQRFFDKGRPAGFLSKAGNLSDPNREKIRREWKAMHEGVDNAFNIGILHGGMQWVPLGYTNDDAQFLQNRQFEVTEVSRWFRLPPHMLGDVIKGNSINIEQLMLEFIMFTMFPICVNWAGEANSSLLSLNEQSNYQIVFDHNVFLQSNLETKSKVEESQIRNGTRTISEIRDQSFMPRYSDGIGDTPLIIASQLDTLANVASGSSSLTKEPK